MKRTYMALNHQLEEQPEEEGFKLGGGVDFNVTGETIASLYIRLCLLFYFLLPNRINRQKDAHRQSSNNLLHL